MVPALISLVTRMLPPNVVKSAGKYCQTWLKFCSAWNKAPPEQKVHGVCGMTVTLSAPKWSKTS
jgi:hypothetical protein